MWTAAAARIVAGRGPQWAFELVKYVRQSRGVGDPARYAASVAATWEGWPDWFEASAEREKVASMRVISTYSAPKEEVSAEKRLLEALPEIEREELAAKALQIVLGESLAPPVRRAVERSGAASPIVQRRMIELLKIGGECGRGFVNDSAGGAIGGSVRESASELGKASTMGGAGASGNDTDGNGRASGNDDTAFRDSVTGDSGRGSENSGSG